MSIEDVVEEIIKKRTVFINDAVKEFMEVNDISEIELEKYGSVIEYIQENTTNICYNDDVILSFITKLNLENGWNLNLREVWKEKK